MLRPRGRLALFWNAGDPPPRVAAAFADVYRGLDTGLPFTPWAAASAGSAYRTIVDRAADGIRRTGAFDEPVRWTFERDMTLSKEAWLEQVPTSGGHNRMPTATLRALLEGMGQVIDREGGSFPLHYTTIVLAARRLP